MDFAVEWKNCKTEFEKLTGKKKPAPKTMGVFRKSTKVQSTAKKVDDEFKNLGAKNAKGTLDEKDIANYDKAVLAYKKEMESYIKLLETTLKAEKDADSAYGKAIIMMKKKLKAMLATMDTQGVNYANQLKKDMSTADKVVAMVIPGMRSSLKKMSAFVAKVNAQKTPEDKVTTFNAGIAKATRDVTQNLTNALKFQKKGMVTWNGKDMTGASKVLTAWSNNGRQLKEGSTEPMIKRELSALAQVVVTAKEWMKANA